MDCDDWDDDRGLWGGEFARSLRGELIRLDDYRFELLFEACRLHTDKLTTGDRTLPACWDADRLAPGTARYQNRSQPVGVGACPGHRVVRTR